MRADDPITLRLTRREATEIVEIIQKRWEELSDPETNCRGSLDLSDWYDGIMHRINLQLFEQKGRD